MDAVATVCLVAASLIVGSPVMGIVAAGWLSLACLLAARSGRIADLVDPRPLVKIGINYLVICTVVATSLGELNDVRHVLLGAGLPLAGSYAVRRFIAHPRARMLLGCRVGESVIVVGSATSAARTIREWHGIPFFNVVGACLSEADGLHDTIEGVPVLGVVADVPAVTSRMPIDIVAVHDVDLLGGLQLARLNWGLEATGTQVSIVTPLTNTAPERVHVRRVGRRVIVDVKHSRPVGVVASLKSAVERVVALSLLVLASPVVLLAGLAVRLTSPGPAIFRQTRVREGAATFTMYKLRTMRQDAEAQLAELVDQNEVGGGLFKMRHDPRITGVGKWLRKLSIDELPQLWNVVRGDMSLIGPRPALPSEVATYDATARRRLTVKPGITGLWQVSGRSNLSWEESVRIDTDYVDNWHPARDISIALKTVKAVVRREGAH
jgi:exopolysaccharide biosynthesis polyprenyl glycosylphosphotransferase